LSDADKRLALRAARGDVGAFSALVREHSGLVYRVSLRVLGARDAQDASQEVWIRVWRNISKFRGDSAFTTWLYRITMNTCLSARQKEIRREERRHAGEMPFLAEPSGGEADPEASALGSERRAELEAALEHIRPDHRAALVLRHMEGLSYAEIAEVLDVPDGTAKGWVSRGRAAMLVALAKEDGHRGGPPEGEGR
jgi:RNA polymerase sigma-70 factor, ECF subfamily